MQMSQNYLFRLFFPLFLPAVQGAQISGVDVPGTITVNGQTLTLNGAGLRSMFVFDVYVAALYTAAASQDAEAIINDTQPRVIALTLLRDVDAASLMGSLKTGLRDNHDSTALAALDPAIKSLEQIVASIGNGQKGYVIQIAADAQGVSLRLNDKDLGRIDEPNLSAAMLRIWLGENPTQSSLKKDLLGK